MVHNNGFPREKGYSRNLFWSLTAISMDIYRSGVAHQL